MTRLVSFASLLALFITAAASAAPKMKVVDDTFVFGKTTQGAVVTHSFWIRSIGTDTLRIIEVEPGCGCTQAPLLDSLLAPGDSTRLEITLNTKNFRGFVDKRPSFVTNASTDRVFLKLYAEMITDSTPVGAVKPNPLIIDVSQFDKLRRKARFVVANTGPAECSLTLVDTAFKSFDVTLPKSVKAGASVEGVVTVREKAITADFRESLTFELGDEERTRFTLPVVRMYRTKQADK